MSAAIAAMASVGPSVAAKKSVSTKAAMPAIAAVTAGMAVAVPLGSCRVRHRHEAGAECEGKQTGGQEYLEARCVRHEPFLPRPEAQAGCRRDLSLGASR